MNDWVLIADDDHEIRDLIKLILESRGLDSLGAADGIETLELLRANHPPRVILLDLRMPRMNGLQVLDELARDDELRKVPVVVITGDSIAGREAMAAGAKAVLIKPLDLDQLVELVSRVGRPGGTVARTQANRTSW